MQGCYDIAANYQQASFKGVSMGQVLLAENSGGRRGAEGEFPFGEISAYTDLGIRINRFTYRCQFGRNSHIQDAADLMDACMSKGPGTLVDPTLGPISAACKHFKFSNSPVEMAGITTVDLEFVEANDQFDALMAQMSGSLASFDLDPLIAAVQDSFYASYLPDDAAYFELPDALQVAGGVISTIATAFAYVVGFTSNPHATRIQNELGTIATNRLSLSTPKMVWAGCANGLTAIDRFGSSPEARIEACRKVINAATQTPSGATSMMQNAVLSTARILGAGYLANAAASSTATTSQDACRQYGMVTTVLRQEMQLARFFCDDALYMALHTFLVDAQRVLLSRVFDSPLVVEYNFNAGVFSVVAAHQIYGDAKRFAEIEARNIAALPFHIGPMVAAVQA